MITKKQVEHIANLARIRLSDEEKGKFSKELSQILDFVEKLKEVETSKVEPFLFDQTKNVYRKDEVNKIDEKQRNKLFEEVPEKEGNYIKTKPIF